jgi:hypothetical protein
VGEVAHRGDGGAECPAYVAVEGVGPGVVEEAEEVGEVSPNE